MSLLRGKRLISKCGRPLFFSSRLWTNVDPKFQWIPRQATRAISIPIWTLVHVKPRQSYYRSQILVNELRILSLFLVRYTPSNTSSSKNQHYVLHTISHLSTNAIENCRFRLQRRKSRPGRRQRVWCSHRIWIFVLYVCFPGCHLRNRTACKAMQKILAGILLGPPLAAFVPNAEAWVLLGETG